MSKIIMPRYDKELVIERYSSRYKKFGYSPKTLGWDKGKQDLRYKILFEEFGLNNKNILDIGCGFGDANKLLQHISQNYSYMGIDIVDDLIKKAQDLYKNDDKISFVTGDFLDASLDQNFDVIVASGVFNFKLEDGNNLSFIESSMNKAFNLATDGISFDFLSNKVDFEHDITFHSNPTDILDIAYSLSRNVILKNNYMPFEFSITVFKDDNFDKTDTIFKKYKNETEYYRFY